MSPNYIEVIGPGFLTQVPASSVWCLLCSGFLFVCLGLCVVSALL